MGIAAGTSIAAWIVRGSLHLTWPEAFGVAGFTAAVFVGVSWLPVTRGRINTSAHIAITFHLLVLSRISFRSPDLDTAREMVSEWGNDASSFAVVLVDGHEVYRKTPDSPPRRRNGWSWRRQHGPQSPEITRG